MSDKPTKIVWVTDNSSGKDSGAIIPEVDSSCSVAMAKLAGDKAEKLPESLLWDATGKVEMNCLVRAVDAAGNTGEVIQEGASYELSQPSTLRKLINPGAQPGTTLKR